MKSKTVLNKGWQLEKPDGKGWLDIAEFPAEVYEILCGHGEIGNEYLTGRAENTKWVAERGWTYRLRFKAERRGHSHLFFGCLDTLADVYLNGVHIASSEDFFLPLRVEVTDRLLDENLLEVKFHSPYKYMDEHPLPPKWQGKFPRNKMLRKPGHDFSNYLGQRPFITQIGVAGDVFLESFDDAEITRCDINAKLQVGYGSGEIEINFYTQDRAGMSGKAELFDMDMKKIAETKLDFSFSNGEAAGRGIIPVNSPALWWPRGFGSQPLYTAAVTLFSNGEIADQCRKKVGFRELHTNLNFELSVNGRRIRLWGSNIAPVDGKTRRWNHERVNTLLNLFEMANMNTVRVWGEGEPMDDSFYEECDERGILVWQEFFGHAGMQPDSTEFYELCRKEAEYLINRIKHHPSLFMWCGGNECFMSAEFEKPGEPYIGGELYLEIYPKLIAELDPDRYYHPSSPYGGPYANCPTEGDTHGYEMWRYSSGMEYPVALTEQMRVSGAAVKSLKRFIPQDELWPEDFTDSTVYSRNNTGLMPKAWEYRAGGMLALKAGPVGMFRDAESPYEMAYKYSAAHACAFKAEIERSRMGRPSGTLKRISNCHLIWKLADTWPLIYSAIIDYYLEPFIPYYTARRAYSPVMACFDVRDSITVWLVNDSGRDTRGKLFYGIFDPKANKFIFEKETEAAMPAGQSGEIAVLDAQSSFRMSNFLYVRYEDKENGIVYTNNHLMDTERRLLFPEAKLNIDVENGAFKVTTDLYAHCVELSGNNGGDEFGFYFEDNYFNLLPGEVKYIRINGKHTKGTISAKAHYSPHVTETEWRM